MSADRSSSPPTPPRHRSHLIVALVAGLASVAAVTAAVLADGPAHDHAADNHHGAAPQDGTTGAASAATLKPVGSELVRSLPGGSQVGLAIAALAEPAAGARLGAVPAGAPVHLRFTLPASDGDALPIVRASRVPSLAAMGVAGSGSHHEGGAAHEDSELEPVSLQREATVLVDRQRGRVMIPNQGGEPGHEHTPGQGLAKSIPGGGYKAAISIAPGASATAVERGGRFLAAAYPDAGRVEFVDLLLGKPAGAARTGGRPTALTFAPDGRVWVTDAARERIAIVDPARRVVSASIDTGSATGPVSFSPHGDRAIVAGRDGAAVVDTRRATILATAALSSASVGAGWAGATKTFAVGAVDGTVTLVPANGRAGRLRRLDLGVDDRVRAFAVAPDGRRAVAAGTAGGMTVVDLRRGRVMGPVPTGKDPVQIAFMGRFALVRDGRAPLVTWVDLKTPSRNNAIPLESSAATSLSITPDGRRAMLAAPKDQKVLVLHGMMGRPMLMEAQPNTVEAGEVLAVGGGLQRTGPRTAELRTVVNQPGAYRITVRVPGRRGRAVFDVPVVDAKSDAVSITPERKTYHGAPGQEVTVAFDVKGRDLGQAQVLAYSTGTAANQVRVAARRVAPGRYEATLTPPQAGVYRVHLESEQADVGARSGPGATLRVDPAGSGA